MHGGTGDLVQRPRAALLHRELELGVQNVDNFLDARLPEGRKPPNVRAPDAHRPRAERQGLIHIGAAPDPAVHRHGDASGDSIHHFGQTLDRRAVSLGGAAAEGCVDHGVERQRRGVGDDRQHVVDLDAKAAELGIVPGGVYNIDIFWAERHTTGSSFQMETTLAFGAADPGVLQFSAPTYEVTENGAFATISVVRTRGDNGPVSVSYATADGTARKMPAHGPMPKCTNSAAEA